MAEKSEAFTVFKSFKLHVEKATDMSPKGLCTNRGGEFTSQEFNNFCKVHGVQRQLTVAYSPQQKGVAERKNRTIMNLVHSMLFGKKSA